MLDKDGHLKITDFGMSKENMIADNKSDTLCVALSFMAPEVKLKVVFKDLIQTEASLMTLYILPC